jgi:pimeloyl-ACP methyl ester carboxylesterase
VAFIERCYTTPNIRVVSVDTALFLRGVDFYRSRTDKEWGLTDCISFVVMQDNSLIAALTTDEHFQQAGFRIKANTLMGLRWVEGGFVRMGGAFWENSQRYMDNSPVFHLNRVSTPLLLLHGTADGLPITQSEEMYTGLLRLGKVAMLVRYHGEGHSPEMWSAENYQDCWRQIVNWFDRYVRYA